MEIAVGRINNILGYTIGISRDYDSLYRDKVGYINGY